jgi:hypothetical protein
MTRRYARNPGQDQIAEWKSAIAASRRQQRNHRGKRKTGIEGVSAPGMVRKPPPQDHPAGQDGGEAEEGTP